MESKAADVFAFGMLAVEVFTGKIPFEERKNQAVVHRISQGGRPGMPGHSEAVGLTVEIWNLLESCWQQDPKKRPAMEGVVRRWRKFLADDDSVLFPECVQTTGDFSFVFSPFSTFLIAVGTQHTRWNRERALVDVEQGQWLFNLE